MSTHIRRVCIIVWRDALSATFGLMSMKNSIEYSLCELNALCLMKALFFDESVQQI